MTPNTNTTESEDTDSPLVKEIEGVKTESSTTITVPTGNGRVNTHTIVTEGDNNVAVIDSDNEVLIHSESPNQNPTTQLQLTESQSDALLLALLEWKFNCKDLEENVFTAIERNISNE